MYRIDGQFVAVKPDSKNTILERLKQHSVTGETLMIEAVLEIERLNKQIADMEKAFLLTKTYDDFKSANTDHD